MKRQYTKPQINIENFRISMNIAGDCNVTISNHAENSCPYIDNRNGNVFLDSVEGCTYKMPDGAIDGICYHVPLSTNDFFNS